MKPINRFRETFVEGIIAQQFQLKLLSKSLRSNRCVTIFSNLTGAPTAPLYEKSISGHLVFIRQPFNVLAESLKRGFIFRP